MPWGDHHFKGKAGRIDMTTPVGTPTTGLLCPAAKSSSRRHRLTAVLVKRTTPVSFWFHWRQETTANAKTAHLLSAMSQFRSLLHQYLHRAPYRVSLVLELARVSGIRRAHDERAAPKRKCCLGMSSIHEWFHGTTLAMGWRFRGNASHRPCTIHVHNTT